MRALRLAAIAALLPNASPSAAQQQLTVAEFLDRWAAIKAEKDKPEQAAQATRFLYVVGDSFKRYKAELDADAKAGKPPRACPAKGSKDSFQLDELVNVLDDLPEARRQEPFDTEFFAFLDRRFPCAGAVSPASPSAPAATGRSSG